LQICTGTKKREAMRIKGMTSKAAFFNETFWLSLANSAHYARI